MVTNILVNPHRIFLASPGSSKTYSKITQNSQIFILPPYFDSQLEQFMIAKNKSVCKTKPYFTFTLIFSFLKTKFLSHG